MTHKDSPTPADPEMKESTLAREVTKRLLQVLMTYLVLAAALFLSSGDLTWGWAWLYLGVSLAILIVNLLLLPAKLIAERGQPGENVKRWDKVLASLASVAMLAVPIVAGLDRRYEWSPQLVAAAHLIGLAFFALGQGLFSWAMASNEYFSTAVRIQMDRGHTVATGGPYRHVRHPGYAGHSVSFLGMSVALGSVWALIPAGVMACLLVVRTWLEDRTLRAELPGYEEYSKRVGYRLFPGLW